MVELQVDYRVGPLLTMTFLLIQHFLNEVSYES